MYCPVFAPEKIEKMQDKASFVWPGPLRSLDQIRKSRTGGMDGLDGMDETFGDSAATFTSSFALKDDGGTTDADITDEGLPMTSVKHHVTGCRGISAIRRC